MSNPFHKSLEEFRGREVIATSNHGETYRGFVDRMHYQDRHVVLHGATNVDTGEHVGKAFLSHADTIELADEEVVVEDVRLERIRPSPYATREFHREQNLGYIERTQNKGFVGSFPVVRRIPLPSKHYTGTVSENFEIVEGHKRLWVCEQAGFDSHPVEVVELTDWDVVGRFVADHIPNVHHINEDGSTHNDWYDNADIEAAIETLVEYWGERVRELPAVAYNIDRLGLEKFS